MFHLGNNHSSHANFVYKGILQPCKEKSVVSHFFELKAGIKNRGRGITWGNKHTINTLNHLMLNLISKQGWAPARLVAQLHYWLCLVYLGCFSCKQIPVLIHELLAVELWKDKVFPKILESGFNPSTTLPIYFVVSFTIMLMFTWWYNLLRILLNLWHSLQSVLVLGIPVDLKFASGRHCCIML